MPLRRYSLRPAMLAAAFGLAVTAGCGEESETSKSSGAGETATVADGKPGKEKGSGTAGPPITVSVTADKTHAVQPSDEIRIEVTVDGFVLDGSKVGAAAEPGTGHYHVYLGGADGEPLLVSAESSDVVKVPADVTDGTHTLRIQLRNHDHSPLDPPVEATARLIIYRL